MCGRRGLLPDSDLQTFQISLTQQFRIHYDKIIAPLSSAVSLASCDMSHDMSHDFVSRYQRGRAWLGGVRRTCSAHLNEEAESLRPALQLMNR